MTQEIGRVGGGVKRGTERDFPLGGRGSIAEKCQESVPRGMQTIVGLEPDFYGLIKFITVINPGLKIQHWQQWYKKTTQSNVVNIIDDGGGERFGMTEWLLKNSNE